MAGVSGEDPGGAALPAGDGGGGGGDPACWLHRLCPTCGGLPDDADAATCPRCGRPLPRDEELD